MEWFFSDGRWVVGSILVPCLVLLLGVWIASGRERKGSKPRRLTKDNKRLLYWAKRYHYVEEKPESYPRTLYVRDTPLYGWDTSLLGDEPSENERARTYWLAMIDRLSPYFVDRGGYLELNGAGLELASKMQPVTDPPENQYAHARAEQVRDHIQQKFAAFSPSAMALLNKIRKESRARFYSVFDDSIGRRALRLEIGHEQIGRTPEDRAVAMIAFLELRDAKYMRPSAASSLISDVPEAPPIQDWWQVTPEGQAAIKELKRLDEIQRLFGV